MGRLLTLGAGKRWDARRTPGLRLLLHATRITGLADADPISTWPDVSGNGNDVTGSTTARWTWKAATLNNRPAARADGSNDLMARANLNLTTFTVFAVVGNMGATAGNGHIVGEYLLTGNLRKWRLLRDATPTNIALNISSDGTSGTVGIASRNLSSTTAPTLITATYDGTTGRIRLNGGTWATVTTGMVATTTPQLTIGSREGTGDPFGGDGGLIAIYNRVLTDAELARNERGIAREYAITVA